jgi:hypothetical protein
VNSGRVGIPGVEAGRADFGFDRVDRSTGRAPGSDPPARQGCDESHGMRIDDRCFLQAVTFGTSRSPDRARRSATTLEYISVHSYISVCNVRNATV